MGVFAHPDDETTGAGGTFAHYAGQGVEVHVVVATRGEEGSLGTGGYAVTREELPAVREAELRAVLELYGAHPPVFLGYRDGQVKNVALEEIANKIWSVMDSVRPDVVITWGPTGISRHDDHIAVHRAAVEAFGRYRRSVGGASRLFYVAISAEALEEFEVDLEVGGPEAGPTVTMDISRYQATKVRALRTYRSQEDAQELADLFEQHSVGMEWFHQADPAAPPDTVESGFWE